MEGFAACLYFRVRDYREFVSERMSFAAHLFYIEKVKIYLLYTIKVVGNEKEMSTLLISFLRRRRDLNPRAAINDLLPFQGSPFGQLGYFSMSSREPCGEPVSRASLLQGALEFGLLT